MEVIMDRQKTVAPIVSNLYIFSDEEGLEDWWVKKLIINTQDPIQVKGGDVFSYKTKVVSDEGEWVDFVLETQHEEMFLIALEDEAELKLFKSNLQRAYLSYADRARYSFQIINLSLNEDHLICLCFPEVIPI